MVKHITMQTLIGNIWVEDLKILFSNTANSKARKIVKKGNVKKLQIENPYVCAKVKDSSRYYKIILKFPQFKKDAINIILDIIDKNPPIFSSLLNHEFPEELLNELEDRGLDIFPLEYVRGNSECHCWNFFDLCPHELAVLYQLGLKIDKDPFLLFKLYGIDLLELLNMPENVIEIENGEDIFNIKDNKDVSEGFIDFSKIPYLHDEILFLLNENPSFYKKNFKNVLDKFYKNLPKYIKKNVDSYTRANKTHSYNTFIHTPKSRKK